MNQITISGRMGGVPELKHTTGGHQVVSISVAVFNGRDREPIWVPVVAFNKVAKFITSHLSKGDPIEISGKLRANQFTKPDGTVVRSLEVEARDVGFPPSSRRQNDTGATIVPMATTYTAQTKKPVAALKSYPVTEGTPSDMYQGFQDAGDDTLPF